MDIDLRHLRVVRAIADAGSVNKAAAVLRVAQPALTTQLQRIERSLGGALFVRERSGVRPTPLGDMVLARARILIPALHELQTEASGMVRAGRVASFRIGATNGPVTGGLVQRLTANRPESHITVHATWSADEIAGLVRAGRLDFALVGSCGESVPMPGNGLVWRTVCVDPVWALLPSAHPQAGRAEIPLGDLAGERWAAAPGDGCFTACFAAACARAGFAPQPCLEMDVGGVFDLVAAGTAVALCQGTVRDVPGVTAVAIAGSPLRWRHLLGWDPAGAAVAAAPDVLGLAVQSYRGILDQRPRYTAWLEAHPGFGAHGGD
ncbi:LysR family transcriptional regulator [Actinoplanes sp. NPDC051494]|uniref:LysR family transcriptional regulator n=1 Tax=Actinoplanes sp. NPDC051494 TaxID=3363907 RepID=UPI003790F307